MDRDTQERPREDGSRAWRDGIPSEDGQGSSHRHKLRERRGRILPHNFQREGRPADTLISGFWLPELGENKLLLFQPRSLWSFVTAAGQSPPRPSNSACGRLSKKGERVTQDQGDRGHGQRPVGIQWGILVIGIDENSQAIAKCMTNHVAPRETYSFGPGGTKGLWTCLVRKVSSDDDIVVGRKGYNPCS